MTLVQAAWVDDLPAAPLTDTLDPIPEEYHAPWVDPDPVRAALEAARHTLTTLNGLWAHDGQPPGAPEQWQIDTRAVLDQLDTALGIMERNEHSDD